MPLLSNDFVRKLGISTLCISGLGVALGATPPAIALTDPCPTNQVCEAYTYDVHGRLVEVEDVKDTSGVEETDTVVYTYDDAGNRTQKTVTTS